MAYFETAWYCNFGNGTTTGYWAVAKRPQNTAVVAGQLCRQFTAPSVFNERCFVCIVAGTTANTTDATWTLTRGANVTDGTAHWMECTGIAAVNGDATNTVTWTQAKAIGAPTVGTIIKRNNGASYQICTTAGTVGVSEPAFSDTAGVTTTETSATTVWTSLGVVANFSGGGAPHALFGTLFGTNWFNLGNTVYVGDNHAEVYSGGTYPLNYTTSVAALSRILCHNHSGSYPPTASDLRTTATITISAGQLLVEMTGMFYFYGLTFSSSSFISLGVGASNIPNWNYFDACSMWSIGLVIGVTSPATYNYVIFNNTTVKFSATNQNIYLRFAQFEWRNTGPILASGSSVPANLFIESGASFFTAVLESLDLSQLTGSLFNLSSFYSAGNLLIKDCKLNASATVTTPPNTGMTVQLVRSDSGATAYKSARYLYEGTETTETSITRVGGATDPTGQAQSRKLVTTANSQWLTPFKAEPYAIWNPTTGANVTVTVYGTINAGALPNNDDIWLEVEYLGSSASPLGTIVTTTKSNLLAANAAVASDGSTWNGGGSGAGWSPFKLTTTLSSPQPGMAGYLHARVRAAKASTTYYIDPKIVLS